MLNAGPLVVECHNLSPFVKVVHLLYVIGHFKDPTCSTTAVFIEPAFCDRRGVKTTDVTIVIK